MASSWGATWGAAWDAAWGTIAGGGGSTVVFHQGVSGDGLGGTAVSKIVHTLVDAGGGTYTVTTTTTVSIDKTDAVSEENYTIT